MKISSELQYCSSREREQTKLQVIHNSNLSHGLTSGFAVLFKIIDVSDDHNLSKFELLRFFCGDLKNKEHKVIQLRGLLCAI